MTGCPFTRVKALFVFKWQFLFKVVDINEEWQFLIHFISNFIPIILIPISQPVEVNILVIIITVAPTVNEF